MHDSRWTTVGFDCEISQITWSSLTVFVLNESRNLAENVFRLTFCWNFCCWKSYVYGSCYDFFLNKNYVCALHECLQVACRLWSSGRQQFRLQHLNLRGFYRRLISLRICTATSLSTLEENRSSVSREARWKGATENAWVENAGASKVQGWKMQDWK